MELGVAVVTRQAAARWLSSPQGAPSGVCTGHRKPFRKGREDDSWLRHHSALYIEQL